MTTQPLTAQRLRAVVHYEPETGVLTWLVQRSFVRVGAIAGHVHKDGYRSIRIEGKDFKAHRLAWLYTHGEWPAADIDHINGERADNRIINLRDVTRSVNRQNMRSATKRNKSTGLLGVRTQGPRDRKFSAQIWINGKHIVIGRFDTAEEAHAAYVQAKRELHAGCTI